mgnify:CR=1 FL=1
MENNESENMAKLNDELLKPDKLQGDDKPKRNSKDFIIERIFQVADENELELNLSSTKLKRMSKEKLQQLLGELCEEAVKTQMAAAVGAQSGNDSVIALATLRMVHDLFANSVEQGLNVFLPKYGFEVKGFSDSLKQRPTSDCVDDCLKEIAAESEILQYVQSPYARLAIAWSGGLMSAIRKKNNFGNNNVAFMGSKPSHTKNPLRPRPSGRETPRQEHRRGGPPQPNVKTV